MVVHFGYLYLCKIIKIAPPIFLLALLSKKSHPLPSFRKATLSPTTHRLLLFDIFQPHISDLLDCQQARMRVIVAEASRLLAFFIHCPRSNNFHFSAISPRRPDHAFLNFHRGKFFIRLSFLIGREARRLRQDLAPIPPLCH